MTLETPVVRPRTFAQEFATALSALDCVLDGERAHYASAELTTGRPLYRLLAETGLRTAAELRQRLGEEEFKRRIFDPNFADALDLARSLRVRYPAELVVTPAPYSIEGWTQREYLALWETVIRTRIKALHFSDDWEYSNGCALEFQIAWALGLPTFNAAGRPLSLKEGRSRLESAVQDLEAGGFDASGLCSALQQLSRLDRAASANS